MCFLIIFGLQVSLCGLLFFFCVAEKLVIFRDFFALCDTRGKFTYTLVGVTLCGTRAGCGNELSVLAIRCYTYYVKPLFYHTSFLFRAGFLLGGFPTC